MIWSAIFAIFPTLITKALEAYNKYKDTELGKYKVDGTVDVAALHAVAQTDVAQASVIKAEQGRWWTASPRAIMGNSVALYIFKVIVLDKLVGPALGFSWWTEPITGAVGVWVGVIISGLFIQSTATVAARIFAGRK